MSSRVDPLVKMLKKYGMVSKSNWALARGIPSKYFFDIDKGAYSSESLRVISNRYARKIKKIREREPGIDRLAFVEKDFGTIGALLFTSSIISRTGIDAIIVRLRKEISLGSVKGASITSQNAVIIVSDVLTSGEGIEKASQTIKEYGAKVPYAVVLFDREQGGRERLQRLGIKAETILTRGQLIQTGDVPDELEVDFSLEEDVIAPSQRKVKEFEEALRPESREILKDVHIK
jgi:orotate phosphoribosyltransferase